MENEPQSTHSNLSRGRGDDATIVFSKLDIPRLESIKTDLQGGSDPSSQNSTPRTLAPNVNVNPEANNFFKTRLCNNFTNKGSCGYGEECTFAHGMEELRNSKMCSWEGRIRVCKMHMRSGKCSYGANCSYLHVETTSARDEIQGQGSSSSSSCDHDKIKRTGTGTGTFCKTNPCFSWRTSGRCSYGSYCRFIHANANANAIYQDSKKRGGGVEGEGGDKSSELVVEGCSRSRISIFSLKPRVVVPSRLKSGSDKLKEMKKVDGIYGDWLD